MDKNIIDASYAIERFLTTKCQTLNLLKLILPIGWRISKVENKLKWVERDLQVTQEEINNVYMSTKNNKVHIYNYYQSDFNKDFLTVRLNVVVDEYDRVTTV